MAVDKERVRYVAHLGRIELHPQEIEKLSRQLEDIVGFIDKLKKLNIEDIEPTSHILPINNVFREDSPKESLPIDKVLKNAPCQEQSSFVVPKVIE
jgi:aspartyl-tRNA(Asn)/glutamyl-tRNA(Gln) amidotransferase subunit C